MKNVIPKPPPETCTESEFQKWILAVAKARDWKVNHVFRAQLSDGQWRTTCSPGWPDLTLVRAPRIVFLEVKGRTGRVEPQQETWLAALAGVACADVWIVDPTMPDDVIRLLF